MTTTSPSSGGPLGHLRLLLVGQKPGELPGDIVEDVEYALAAAWDDLPGSDEGGMQGYKLRGRTEDMRWEPPVLRFAIERHGAAALGSTRAELQRWEVDITDGSAGIVGRTRRQLRAMAPRLNVRPIAQGMASAIAEGADHLALKWSLERDAVRVLVGRVPEVAAGSAVAQTLAGRRRRFRAALAAELAAVGWSESRMYTYKRDSAAG